MVQQPSRLYGYARPSHSDPSCASQSADIQSNASVDGAAIFIEEGNCPYGVRPSWLALCETIRRGDVIVISDLSRLGRDTSEVFHSAGILIRNGCSLSILHPSGGLAGLDSERLHSVLLDMADLDRTLRKESNTSRSLIRPLGRRGGRKPIATDDQISSGLLRIRRGETVSAVAADLGVSRQAFHKRAKRLQMRSATIPVR